MSMLLAMLVATAVSAAPARAAQDDLASPKLRIEWAEFKKLYDDNTIVVVDVRDPASFEAARIPASINVPLDEVGKRVAELKKRGKTIVFYCA